MQERSYSRYREEDLQKLRNLIKNINKDTEVYFNMFNSYIRINGVTINGIGRKEYIDECNNILRDNHELLGMALNKAKSNRRDSNYT